MLTVLNNKCHFTKEEFLKYQQELSKLKGEIILCPSSIHIPNFNLTNIKLGSQNVSATANGAYTGEISATQLSSYQVEYCIVGHSERRLYQQETNLTINNKIKRLYEEKIIPILCVGETLEERQNKKTKEVIEEEINEAIKDLSIEEKNKLIIAYEPIWSIGTGIIPTNEEIEEVLKIIKNILPVSSLLYGGSVSEENASIIEKCSLLDGFLLGGLSLNPINLELFLQKLTK